MNHKRIIIIAGPNGAGKTTFARSFLPGEAQLYRFINADLIAAGLDPFAPEEAAIRAGRIMLSELSECERRRESFAFETTLSGVNYLKHIRRWRTIGYRVTLYFLSLPNIELALSRVAERVSQGGHNVPENVVRRRFESGLTNFRKIYRSEVDDWILYENSGVVPVITEAGSN